MVQFRKRKSDGQSFPLTNNKKIRANNPSNDVGGVKVGKGTKVPRMKEIPIFKYKDAPEDLQEKILEKQRNIIAEDQDNFFAQDEGILFDKDEKKDGQDIGLKNLFPENFDVESNRGEDFIQFNDLEIDDIKKFTEYLGLAKSLGVGEQLGKISIDFENLTGSFGSDNTRLIFKDVNGSEIDLVGDTSALDEHYSEDKGLDEDERMFRDEDIPTLNEFVTILQAFDKFADLMDDSLINLRNNFENQFEEETIIENIEANDYDFDEDGNIA